MKKLTLLCLGLLLAFITNHAAAAPTRLELIPQEEYGDTLLTLLDSVNSNTQKIQILQFNFFLDNQGPTLPKQVAKKLISLKKSFPRLEIEILLESQKDLDQEDGKGVAQRNLLTKQYFLKNGIQVFDITGLDPRQTPTGRPGVSHAKVVRVDDTILAGSTNLTQRSTTPGANNEMNLLVQSARFSATLSDFIEQVKSEPSQMHDLQALDGEVEMLTDRLLFDRLIALIEKASAGESLHLSMYQFLYRDDRDVQAKALYEKLVQARARGAQVQVFLERTKDVNDPTFKANFRVGTLLTKSGVEVCFDPPDKISHSKFLIYRGKSEKIAILGSANYYRGDFNENHQVNWQVSQSEFVDSLFTYYNRMLAQDGERL